MTRAALWPGRVRRIARAGNVHHFLTLLFVLGTRVETPKTTPRYILHFPLENVDGKAWRLAKP